MKPYHEMEVDTMLRNSPNLYQRARKESPYTQEQAAELLSVSETTLKAWEQGQRVPDNEAVGRMADIYETPWLRLDRALEVLSELGILEETEESRSLSSAVLSHWDTTSDVMDRYRRLIQITADGLVDASEQTDYLEIRARILRSSVEGLKVAFYHEDFADKKRTAPTRARRRGEVHSTSTANDCRNIISHRTGIARETFARRGGAPL